LNYDLKEADIVALFSAFGKVTRCDLGTEPSGKSKGFAFLEFAEPQMAEAAMVMNGFRLANRDVRPC
jgi:RNA-binding protein 23/39